MIRRLALAFTLATLLAAFAHPSTAHAHAQMFAVSVGRNGFDGAIEYTLDVEAGHEVTITFNYADGDMSADNAHDIRIKGAGLELPTVRLSKDRPTASITFTPTKSGTLRILCIVPCIGMENLVGGRIKVVKPRATGAATSLTLELSPRDDGSILARAKLLDAKGNPMADAPIIFTLRTSLGGDLVLGTPTTIDNGSAVVKIPTVGSETLKVTAAFEGGNGIAYSDAYAEITAPGLPMQHQPAPLSAPTAPPALAIAILIVLGGVWAAYAVVAGQIVGIRRG